MKTTIHLADCPYMTSPNDTSLLSNQNCLQCVKRQTISRNIPCSERCLHWVERQTNASRSSSLCPQQARQGASDSFIHCWYLIRVLPFWSHLVEAKLDCTAIRLWFILVCLTVFFLPKKLCVVVCGYVHLMENWKVPMWLNGNTFVDPHC